MSSNSLLRGLRVRFRDTVLSKLLFTYVAIMLVMLAAESLLLGQIYQQEYMAERRSALLKDATDLALTASTAFIDPAVVPAVALRDPAYALAKRQNVTVWIVDRAKNIASMSTDSAGTKGSAGEQEQDFKFERMDDSADFSRCFVKAMHGDIVTEKGLFADKFKYEVMTVAVPILYQNVSLGVVMVHAKMLVMYTAVEQMYKHILLSAAVAMALGIVLILLMSSRISRPLGQMNDIARRIARGDFSAKAEVRSKDEIGQLAQSFNTMAEELKKQEDLRSGFVANVSHELRSPLTSIHGFAQGMLDGTIPRDDHQKYLEVIVGETRRLNKLIRELLDLSQIESGKFPLNVQSFDINELISRVLITFEEKIESKELEIEVDFRQNKAIVLADPDRIEQVLINLLDNAIKFTERGGQIKIWTHGTSDRTLIGISDTGPGIPEEDQPYVWERFYKVDKSHTGNKGTGLGLSIVKKIIDQHGERITLQSKPGSGAMFVFSLKKPD